MAQKMMEDGSSRNHRKIMSEAERLAGQECEKLGRSEARGAQIEERNEGPIEEIDEGMEDEQEEDEIMDDNTLMRLGIHEEWYETFGDLNQMCKKSVKSWDSDRRNERSSEKRREICCDGSVLTPESGCSG